MVFVQASALLISGFSSRRAMCTSRGSDHVLLKMTSKVGHVNPDLKCLFYTQFEYEK